MHLNYSQITPPAMGKLSSMKLVPGAKDVGDHCSRRFRTWEDGKHHGQILHVFSEEQCIIVVRSNPKKHVVSTYLIPGLCAHA